MIYSAPAATFYALLENAPTGSVGTMGVRLLKASDGSTATARVTTGIIEVPSGSGTYIATMTAPSTLGEYIVFWDSGSVSPTTTSDEELQVTQSLPAASTPSGSDLCTLADVRAADEAPSPDTARDPLIQTLITAASAAIMDEFDREFAPATASATRRFRVDNYSLSLAPYDLRTVSTMTLHPESTSPAVLTAGTDYELQPVGAPSGTYTSVRFSAFQVLISDTAFRMGNALVDIAGAWGFASVPDSVRRACVLTVLSWIRRDVSALGLSNEFEANPTASPTAFGIPYEARRLLSSFYRLRAFAF